MTYTHETILTHDSVEQSIGEHALDYGIPASRIVQRLVAGWTVEAAITRPVQISIEKRKAAPITRPKQEPQKAKRTYGRKLTHAGRTLSLAQWAQELGITRRALALRLASGWPLDRALTLVDGRRSNARAHLLDHDGQRRTFTEWSRLTGIPVATIRARVQKGWTVDEALSTPSLTRHGIRREADR